jgi:dienelactone hydrolase
MIGDNIRSIAAIVIIGLAFAFSQPALCAPVEDRYAREGPFAATNESIPGYEIFYPTNMTGNHPIITWGNGTGAPTIVYQAFLDHLASWGFVVIATDSVMTQAGTEMIGGIDYLIEQNSNSSSKFYGMLDVDHIGTTGHSQGGGGAINAATDSRVTCTAPLAPSSGSIEQVDGPIFLVAGQMDFIVSSELVDMSSYAIANAPAIFGIHSTMGHLGFIGNGGDARGYVTAWFMYHLQADDYAAQAFVGECEICEHSSWEVKMKNFP